MNVPTSLRRLFADAVTATLHALNDNTIKVELTPEQRLHRALDPPHDTTEETLHGTRVPDPFRPLEKLDAAETADWVARENKRFDAFMRDAKAAEKAALDFMNKSRPSSHYESMPGRHGDKYFVWRMEEKDIRPCFYVKDVADYGAPARLLIDPRAIDSSGKTNIVNAHVSGDGKTVAYRLSVSGSDKETLHFMDVATGQETGPVYSNFRSAVIWDDDNAGFHYMKSDPATKSSSVMHHTMGTPIAADTTVYAPHTPETGASYFRLDKEPEGTPGDFEWLHVSGPYPENSGLLLRRRGSDEKFSTLLPQADGSLSPVAEVGGKIYAMTDVGAPHERLVCLDPAAPAPANWQTVVPEDPDDLLTDAFIWQGKIFATYRHDTGEQLRVFSLNGQRLHDVPIPPLSTFTLGQRQADDPTCLVTYSNYQETGNIYTYDSRDNSLTLSKKSGTPIDLKDCIVERIQATSKDGTKVPMTVIRAPGTKLDGTAATLLYGYGGFNVPQQPAFSASIAQWVRAGGIYAIANLRGGGEFGKAWYDGGRLHKKQNVFDDFAACAEHLIKNKYTTSKRLAIQGGSNGGLLTLATMIQRPELFGAVVSEVPVTDMFRFHIGSYYGYSWKSDYGDPGLKDAFNTAAKYSPLHNVKDGFRHPPLLIKTDAHDDRVLPWHSYKMAATLQTKEDPMSLTLLRIRTDGGHSAGMTYTQWCADVASVRAFLVKTLGPINQNEYKARLAAETATPLPKPKGPKAA